MSYKIVEKKVANPLSMLNTRPEKTDKLHTVLCDITYTLVQQLSLSLLVFM